MRSVRRHLPLTILAAGLAAAQSHPNFSGSWKQDPSRPAVWLGDLQYENRIDHRDPVLRFTTMLIRGGRPQYVYGRTYTIGAKPVTVAEAGGRQVIWTAAWEGRSIVLESERRSEPDGLRGLAVSLARWLGQPAGVTVTRETWSLSDDGGTLTKRWHTTGSGAPDDRTLVLIRAEAPPPRNDAPHAASRRARSAQAQSAPPRR